MPGRDVSLAGEAGDPEPCEAARADDPVRGAHVQFRSRFRLEALVDLGIDGAPELILGLGDLEETVVVGGDPALGAGGRRRSAGAEAGGPAFVAPRYRAGLLRALGPRAVRHGRVVVELHAGEQLAAEMDTGARTTARAVQAAEAGPVEHGDLVGARRWHRPGKAVEVERGQHEPRAAVPVVVLARGGGF